MKVEDVLFMKGGVGDDSYVQNSSVQREIIEKAKPTLEKALKNLYGSSLFLASNNKSFTMADLGCSSGPNALEALSVITDVLHTTSLEMGHPKPDIKAFLNDLPGTDFNTLFRLLTRFHGSKLGKDEKLGAWFVSGTPGSFYGRLYPDNFLHFVHSSSALHFLSQMPKGLGSGNGEAMNNGNICIAKTSPAQVQRAYYQQFSQDFTLFLRCRSKEIIHGGFMVLTFRIAYDSKNPEFLWDFQFLGLALNLMALQGLVEKEKVDGFNMPFYTPTVEEVKRLIESEGSFAIHNAETFRTDWGCAALVGSEDVEARAKFVEDGYRAATRPALASEFGEAVMDGMFGRFNRMLVERLFTAGNLDILNLVVSLRKIS
ncbi:hypothetical protein V2J09_018699 [Rumex salicifolius]